MLPGDRVSVLVPPSCDLLVAAGAIWKAGGVPVVADASAGIRQLRRLVRAAAPRFTVGTPSTLAAALLLRFAPGATRMVVGPTSPATAPGALELEPSGTGRGPHTPVPVGPDDVAAIVHTSGATGPAKAVRYTHGALAAQRDVVGPLFGMRPGDAFTTSFGPFMLLAPSLQMTCVRPDFPVDKPSALGFDELKAATSEAHVTVAWLSPASARRVVASAHGRSAPIDLVMLAGAPIPPGLVAGVRAVTGGDVRTPFGMTECLPVTDGTDPEAVGPFGGNSTGRPVPGCSVVTTPLDVPTTSLSDGTWGELLVRAPWMFDGYDAAWSADADTWTIHDGLRYHRTGDVGYVHDGLVFHLGRRRHVLDTGDGPLASVAARRAGPGGTRTLGGGGRYRAGRWPGRVHRGRRPGRTGRRRIRATQRRPGVRSPSGRLGAGGSAPRGSSPRVQGGPHRPRRAGVTAPRRPMRVLVTGGSSLLGRTVADLLVGRGDASPASSARPAAVRAEDVLGDIRDGNAVQSAAGGHDAIVHLAALVAPRPGVDRCLRRQRDWYGARARSGGPVRSAAPRLLTVGGLRRHSRRRCRCRARPLRRPRRVHPLQGHGRTTRPRSRGCADGGGPTPSRVGTG